MARHDLNDTGADQAVDAYLAALAARLPRPVAGHTEAIVAELRDGLLAAADAAVARGLAPAAAARAAVDEFGPPATVAAAFAPEVAAVRARRTALALTRSGPLVGGLWVATFAASALPPWREELTGVWLVVAAVALGVAAALLSIGVVVASTGRLGRWLPLRPRLAPTAAASAGLLCLAVDTTAVTTLTVWALTEPATLAWAPAGVAVAASVSRAAVALGATRRVFMTRGALQG